VRCYGAEGRSDQARFHIGCRALTAYSRGFRKAAAASERAADWTSEVSSVIGLGALALNGSPTSAAYFLFAGGFFRLFGRRHVRSQTTRRGRTFLCGPTLGHAAFAERFSSHRRLLMIG
jgi:hypothetical protein